MFKYISSIFLNVFTLNELCELSTNINETTVRAKEQKFHCCGDEIRRKICLIMTDIKFSKLTI